MGMSAKIGPLRVGRLDRVMGKYPYSDLETFQEATGLEIESRV